MTPDERSAERLARLEERVDLLHEQIRESFTRVDRDVVIAREQYPTRADITKGMQDAIIEARTVAREEANMAYDRAATESHSESDKAAAALKALENQTDRAILSVAGRLEVIREELLSKLEDANAGRSVIVVLSAIAIVAGIAGFIYSVA
jgi:hypothetical protein